MRPRRRARPQEGPLPPSLTAGIAIGAVLAVLGSGEVRAQAPPGTADELRTRLSNAELCYELIDYRCVISALEGPLLVRPELPPGLDATEVRTAYELLALGYLAVGLDPEARRAFGQLLRLQPDYRLTRPEASPESVALVERLAEVRRLELFADDVVRGVATSALVLASLPDARQRALEVVAAMSAAELARYVARRVRTVAPAIEDPPWGPFRGPVIAVGFAVRPLLGTDADVFDVGLGLDARLGVTYRPLYLGAVVDWTRHETILTNPVVVPTPPLDVIGIALEGGLRDMFNAWLGWSATLEVGGQYLHVTETLRVVNPNVAMNLELRAAFEERLAVRLGLHGGAIFGDVTNDDGSRDAGASADIFATVGLSWEP